MNDVLVFLLFPTDTLGLLSTSVPLFPRNYYEVEESHLSDVTEF